MLYVIYSLIPLQMTVGVLHFANGRLRPKRGLGKTIDVPMNAGVEVVRAAAIAKLRRMAASKERVGCLCTLTASLKSITYQGNLVYPSRSRPTGMMLAAHSLRGYLCTSYHRKTTTQLLVRLLS